MLNVSSDLSIVIIVSDASIKNNITISIAHIYLFNSSLKKTLHHTSNVITMKVELFAIRCRINQAIQILGTSHIIIITDALYVVQRIFNSTIHLYQIQLITISKNLQNFFNKHLNNSVKFWTCSSDKNWHLYTQVDKDTKKLNLILLYSSKMSWNFSKKKKYNDIIKEWHDKFKTSSLERKFFLNLLNNDLLDIEFFYIEGEL